MGATTASLPNSSFRLIPVVMIRCVVRQTYLDRVNWRFRRDLTLTITLGLSETPISSASGCGPFLARFLCFASADERHPRTSGARRSIFDDPIVWARFWQEPH